MIWQVKEEWLSELVRRYGAAIGTLGVTAKESRIENGANAGVRVAALQESAKEQLGLFFGKPTVGA